jgi:Flp pilus assembly protein TadG
MDFRNRANDRRRGAAMVEFSLSFLLFFTMIIGIAEGALMVWSYTTLNNAVREGGRYAMTHNFRNPVSDEAIENVVKSHAPGLDGDEMEVSVEWADSDKAGGTQVTIAAAYPLSFFASDFIFPNKSIDLTATSKTILLE